MPTTLPPLNLQAPLVDPRSGVLTRTGAAWLQASYVRQGGHEAASNTELAGGVVLNAGHIQQVEDDLGSTSTDLAALTAEVEALQLAFLQLANEVTALTGRVDTLEDEVATVQGQVSSLESTVAAHASRLDALEAWKAAMQAALPATVTVTTIPALVNDPATAIVLENDLTANWRPPMNANDGALATTVNAVRNALAA